MTYTVLGSCLITFAITALVFFNAGRRHERERNRAYLREYVRRYGR